MEELRKAKTHLGLQEVSGGAIINTIPPSPLTPTVPPPLVPIPAGP